MQMFHDDSPSATTEVVHNTSPVILSQSQSAEGRGAGAGGKLVLSLTGQSVLIDIEIVHTLHPSASNDNNKLDLHLQLLKISTGFEQQPPLPPTTSNPPTSDTNPILPSSGSLGTIQTLLEEQLQRWFRSLTSPTQLQPHSQSPTQAQPHSQSQNDIGIDVDVDVREVERAGNALKESLEWLMYLDGIGASKPPPQTQVKKEEQEQEGETAVGEEGDGVTWFNAISHIADRALGLSTLEAEAAKVSKSTYVLFLTLFSSPRAPKVLTHFFIVHSQCLYKPKHKPTTTNNHNSNQTDTTRYIPPPLTPTLHPLPPFFEFYHFFDVYLTGGLFDFVARFLVLPIKNNFIPTPTVLIQSE